MTLAENLRRYWREHLVHVAVAALAGWLLTTGWWPAGAAIAAEPERAAGVRVLEQAGHHQP